MRTALPLVMAVMLAAIAIPAQPIDGNIVMSLIDTTNSANPQNGVIVYFDTLHPNTLTTMAVNATPSSFHNWVLMAPDNRDLVVAEASSGFTFANLVRFDPGGMPTTIAANLPGYINGFELDGDNTWICASASNYVFGVNHTTGATATYVSSTFAYPYFNEIAILREQGLHYVVANFTQSTGLYPKIFATDRSGIITTLLYTAGQPLLELCGIEVDPRRGDFITLDFCGPLQTGTRLEPNGVEVNRVSLGGQITQLVNFGVNGGKIAQDDTIWLGGLVFGTAFNTPALMQFDLATSTVITTYTFQSLPNSLPISGVEIYGSHALTCSGQGGPGATIALDINSQNRFAGGAGYQIALSFGRRPGVKLPNGEWLHLNVLEGLFSLTAQNLAPMIFRNFSGTLDVLGSARASIQLPGYFPKNLGITVFAAAVIYNLQGVLQVTNTHWFEI
jgi:hypothetical protein